MEKTKPSAEKTESRFEKIRAKIFALPEVFAESGHVNSYWKTHHGERTGPYYRLIYKEAGRRRSIYLGNSPELAERVKRLLDDRQCYRRDRLWSQKLRAQIRAALRKEKANLEALLEPLGYRMKGYAFYRRKPQKTEQNRELSPSRLGEELLSP